MNADHQPPVGGVTRRVFIKRTAATALACAVASSLFLSEARAADPPGQCYNPNANGGTGGQNALKCVVTVHGTPPNKCIQAGADPNLPCFEYDIEDCAKNSLGSIGMDTKPIPPGGGWCNTPKKKTP
jgi:hypothetical protein